MELFQGYNTFSGGDALTTGVTGTAGNPEAEIKSTVTMCSDTESVFNSLEIDASVAASYGMFSGDAKFKFVSEMKLTTNSVTVLVHCKNAETTTGSKFKIDKDADELLTAKTANFVAAYGDCFVNRVTKGAEYIAAFVFYSETLEKKLDIEASLGFKVNGGGGSLDASLSTKLQTAQSSAKVSMSLFQVLTGFKGGTVGLPIAEADKIIEFGLGFSKLAPDAPVTCGFAVTGYEHAGVSSPELFKPVAANRLLFTGNGSPGFPGLGVTWFRLNEMFNMSVQIKKLYGFYNYKDEDFESKTKKIRSDMDTVRSEMDQLAADPLAVHQFSSPETYGYGAPQVSFRLRTINGGGTTTWGSPHGFTDITPDQVYQQPRIKSLQVNSGDRIDMLTVEYETNLPVPHTTRTVVHGSQGGQLKKIELDAGEWVSEVDAWQDSWALSNIKIVTTGGQSLQPKPGTPPGVLNWKKGAANNNYLLGFAGSAGGDVNDLDLLVLVFQPVEWVPWDEQLTTTRVRAVKKAVKK